MTKHVRPYISTWPPTNIASCTYVTKWPYEVSDWPPGHIVTDVPLTFEKLCIPALPPMYAPMPRHTLRKRFCKWCGSKLQAPPNEVTTYDEYTGEPIEPRVRCMNQKCPGRTTVKL